MAIPPAPQRSSRPTDYQVFASRYPEVIERLRLLRKWREDRLANLARLSGRKQHAEIRQLLRWSKLHFLYAYEALRAKGLLRESTPDTINTLANACNPFAPVIEDIDSHWIVRSNKPRLVQNFGPLKRMHQLLVADVLRSLHPPRSDQFLFHGGMPKALKAIEDAFRGGNIFAVEIDIVRFYPMVRYSGLADALHPLPKAVVDHVVWDLSYRNWIDDDHRGDADDPAHTSASSSGLVGLSLGASTSPVVGETIIGKWLQTSQPGTVVVYADNILVLGQGEDDVAQRVERLREAALGLPTGPLELRVGSIRSFCDRASYVKFAGQWGRAIRHRLDWQPDERKQQEHLVGEIGTGLSLDAIAAAERKLLHWRRSYSMWRTGDRWVLQQLAGLAAIRYYKNAQPEHLADARYKLAEAYLAIPGIELPDLLPEGSTELHRQRRMTLMNAAQEMIALMAARFQGEAA